MIRYFFKLAFRNIKKYRINSIINILGLSVGFAAFILIVNVVRFDLSYDKYHEKADRIFRVEVDMHFPEATQYWRSNPYPMASKLKADYPEIENFFRECGRMLGVIKYKDVHFFENTGIYADNSIFDILTIDFISGSPKKALAEIYSIVLTEKFANKYFGDKDPIGEILVIDNKYSYKVTGIISDFPENSSIRPDYIGSMQSYVNEEDAQSWSNHFVTTYILLKKGVNHEEFNVKIKDFLNQFNNEYPRYLFLNPITKIHTNISKSQSIWSIIYLFSATAIFILLIASLNFITLNNANLATRIKEIKIQKIMGSTKRMIFLQHIGESLLISFISFDFGLFIAERAFLFFCGALNRTIDASFFLDYKILIILFAIAMLIGFISGLVSVSKIVNLKPFWVIGISDDNNRTISYSRRISVIVQFFISIVLIVATIIANKQLNYLKNKDIGFDKKNLICCSIGIINNQHEKLETFKQELIKNSSIEAVSYAYNVPYLVNNVNTLKKVGDADDNPYSFYLCLTDLDYINVYNFPILKGEGFTQSQVVQDQHVCLINETAQNMLGWDDPIGRQLEHSGRGYKSTIIGVVKDYHIYSIQHKIPALYVDLIQDSATWQYSFAMVRIKPDNLLKGRKYASKKLNEFFPELPYSFFVFDNDLNVSAIRSAEGIERVLGFFSLIAIIIACMGVFGLVALTVKQKTKEIGIRKVMGASVIKIFQMISKDFMILLLISNVLAIPTSWFVIKYFLQNFAYQTALEFTDFLIAIVLSIVFTLLALLYHTVKAARTNPVEALRYE